MRLPRHVVVMAIDRFAVGVERRQMPAQRLDDERHHAAPVRHRVILRPVDRLDIVVEEFRALAEVGEIAVGQVHVVALHVAPRGRDEMTAKHVADAARTGMQHHPRAILGIEANFDEMIAAAQRTQLADPGARELALHLHHFRMLFDDAVEPLRQRTRRPGMGAAVRLLVIVLTEADRHRILDRTAHLRQRIGQVFRRKREPYRVHAAADVHPDGGGNDRALRRNHAAHGRADSSVDIRHGRDVSVDDRQLRNVDELLQRFVLDVLGPHLHGDAALVELHSDRHDSTLRSAGTVPARGTEQTGSSALPSSRARD